MVVNRREEALNLESCFRGVVCKDVSLGLRS